MDIHIHVDKWMYMFMLPIEF